MLVGRQLNLEDYWGILRRRYWLILISALLGPIAAYFIAKQLPPRYTSTNLILLEQPKMQESIVPIIVGNDLVARLVTMDEQILSLSLLEPIIRRYGLYK